MKRRRQVLTVAAVALGGAAGLMAVSGAPGIATGSAAEPGKADRSARLRSADARGDATPLLGRDARRFATQIAGDLPLPDGGNFNGIRFEELDGTISGEQVEFVLAYNAACQWHRALHDGREDVAARQVVADVPSWPGMRGTPVSRLLSQAAEEARSPTGADSILPRLLEECAALHTREVAYARARGNPASS